MILSITTKVFKIKNIFFNLLYRYICRYRIIIKYYKLKTNLINF